MNVEAQLDRELLGLVRVISENASSSYRQDVPGYYPLSPAGVCLIHGGSGFCLFLKTKELESASNRELAACESQSYLAGKSDRYLAPFR